MVYHLTRIRVWPVVKMAFIISGVIGLCIGGLSGLMLTVMSRLLNLAGGEDVPSVLGTFAGAAGFVLVIMVAMMYAVFGAVAVAFATWLYNVLAKMIGGIELFLEGEPGLESPRPVVTESAPVVDTPPVEAPSTIPNSQE